MKERPWAEYLTSLPKKGGGHSIECFRLEPRKSACVMFYMPPKQIIGQTIMYNGTTSVFQNRVMTAYNTLNGTLSL